MELGGRRARAKRLLPWRIRNVVDDGSGGYTDVEDDLDQGKKPGGAVLAGIWGADDDEHRVHLLKCSALGRGIGRAISMAVLLCTGALAQHADISTASEDSASYREIVLAEPQLPNRPARRENISDEEVREIQRVALEVYPDFIVVISSVTDGC